VPNVPAIGRRCGRAADAILLRRAGALWAESGTIGGMRGVCAIIVSVALTGAVIAAAPATVTETGFTAKAVSVHDGDTLRVLDASNREHTIRLAGIDAPEARQPFGTRARDELAAITKGRTVEVFNGKPDKYGRTVARVEVDGHDVGERLVREGLAWHYLTYSRDPMLAAAEREAREAKRGLWVDRDPVPPWTWRASERERRRKPVR
jgi:micrococcal nuclease